MRWNRRFPILLRYPLLTGNTSILSKDKGQWTHYFHSSLVGVVLIPGTGTGNDHECRDRDRDRVNMIKVPPRGYDWLRTNLRAFTFSRRLCTMPRVILVRPSSPVVRHPPHYALPEAARRGRPAHPDKRLSVAEYEWGKTRPFQSKKEVHCHLSTCCCY